jgi:hypothetical protein
MKLTPSQKRHLKQLQEVGPFTETCRWTKDRQGFDVLVQDRSHKGFVTHVFERLMALGVVTREWDNTTKTYTAV